MFARLSRVAVALLMSVPLAASSQTTVPSQCYNIRNADLKAYCLATTRRQESYCYNVKDGDKKHFCLAQVGRRRSACYNIADWDLKQLCLAWVPEAR